MPTEVLINGKVINSPKKLANAFNDGYHEKTEKIRESFTETNIDPVDVMKEVIPTKNENTLEFQQSTPEEVLEIILKSKNSRTCGFDSINMQIETVSWLCIFSLSSSIQLNIKKS